jgi:HAD superfamily hydrolase (TIGR01509 family)
VDVWQEIYREHGHELPVDEWAKTIGGYGLSNFDAATHLSGLTGREPAPLRADYRQRADAIIHAKSIQPGVLDLIHNGKKKGLKLAVGSSSPHSWVDTHLARLGLSAYFDKVICSENVGPGRTKPNPDIFLEALNQLGVKKEAAVIFEDSPNGVKAARTAGVFVVAVPNPLTARLGVHGAGADLTVNSLAEVTVDSLNALLSRR